MALTSVAQPITDSAGRSNFDPFAIPLTSVRQPRHKLGATAADLLLAEVRGDPDHVHRHVVLPPDLVVRASTDRAPRLSVSSNSDRCRLLALAQRRGSAPRTRPPGV
jgi:hypothetical protein